LANLSSSDYSYDDGITDAVGVGREKPSMKNLVARLEAKDQREIGESILRYKNKLEAENKLNDQTLTHEDLLEKDITDGKYPELSEQRDDLHHLYRRQKMRDLKKAQIAKVKSLSQMHLKARGLANNANELPIMKNRGNNLISRFSAAPNHMSEP